MMTCEEARGATVLAAYGELEARGQGALRAHVIACAECAAQAREIRAARELMARTEGHELPKPAAAPPSGMVAEIPSMPSGLRSGRLLPLPRAMGALPWSVAAAAVLVALVLLWPREPSETQPLLASGAIATGSGESLVTDTFDDEVKSLQSDLSSLESRVREF